ncbi:uncharacterized protein G2W53_007635 [Senna tora]|uniref:Uncharacterized protein n=1 Tax=Senna tora TaxID=362788 RepID=A0A834X5Q7_9FABA|nr:uncharacterized protein G2W53_007635 [Senna tora]
MKHLAKNPKQHLRAKREGEHPRELENSVAATAKKISPPAPPSLPPPLISSITAIEVVVFVCHYRRHAVAAHFHHTAPYGSRQLLPSSVVVHRINISSKGLFVRSELRCLEAGFSNLLQQRFSAFPFFSVSHTSRCLFCVNKPVSSVIIVVSASRQSP